MELTPLILSRLQFAWVIAFHILLPAFTVGLASYIAFLEGLYFFTKKEIYFRISIFWIKIFAISFGMGVVSGIVMPFQIGTNWSNYADATANVLSPLFAYEGLTAFFLEASFLGVLLFGRNLVPRWAHFIAALMVALGTLISTFWILSANSWMQTPDGYQIVDGRFFPADWWKIVFNPSFPFRLSHNVVAFYITTGFVICGVGAYFIRRKRDIEEGKAMLSMAFWLLALLVPLQLILGDLHGLNTLKYQPIKLAAIEALWDTEKRTALTLFALPNEKEEKNDAVLAIPEIGSLILTHRKDGEVKGLKSAPPEDRPPVAIPFFAFRIMVGFWCIMFGLIAASMWLRLRKRLYDSSLFLKVCELCIPIGFFSVIAGWVVTEVGRQPWTVYGLLRTSHSVTPALNSTDVIISFAGYAIVYLLIFPFGFGLMMRIIRNGFAKIEEKQPIEGGQPRGPVVTPPEYTSHDH